ncbi:hypothetical protein SNEBB_008669 [Seison nebaliae]|nr:hypothetical protein SNEBB_008669 [Seison nebaliae]
MKKLLLQHIILIYSSVQRGIILGEIESILFRNRKIPYSHAYRISDGQKDNEELAFDDDFKTEVFTSIVKKSIIGSVYFREKTENDLKIVQSGTVTFDLINSTVNHSEIRYVENKLVDVFTNLSRIERNRFHNISVRFQSRQSRNEFNYELELSLKPIPQRDYIVFQNRTVSKEFTIKFQNAFEDDKTFTISTRHIIHFVNRKTITANWLWIRANGHYLLLGTLSLYIVILITIIITYRKKVRTKKSAGEIKETPMTLIAK